MVIVPSIDVRDGRARGEDPVAIARWYVSESAEELHLVDLDAAHTGLPRNRAVLARAAAEAGVPARLAGGLSSLVDAEGAFADGFAGVLFSSAVLADGTLLREIAALGERAIVEVESRDGALDPRGGARALVERARGLDAVAAAHRAVAAGIRALYAVDLSTDGALGGPGLGLIDALRSALGPDVALHTGGGIRDLDDVRTLARRGVASAVIGRALMERRFSLADAKAACE